MVDRQVFLLLGSLGPPRYSKFFIFFAMIGVNSEEGLVYLIRKLLKIYANVLRKVSNFFLLIQQ